MSKFCTCNTPGSRVEMIKESYFNPIEDRYIYKYLCCDCGFTEEIDYEEYLSYHTTKQEATF